MSDLQVRFWGVRGSIPTPGPQTEKYGGNTTCLELRHESTIIVIDAGSGLRSLAKEWLKEFHDKPIKAHLLFTHLHWDHIQGFPFFTPGYQKNNELIIYGEEKPTGSVERLLDGQMQGAYFPVPLSAMQASLSFESVTPDSSFCIGGLTIKTFELPHPGGCLGYRIESEKGTFLLATDCELDKVALNKEAVDANHETPRKYDRELLDFFSNVQVLVIDCQYTDDEYKKKRGWGHNSITTVADLCRQVNPGTIVMFHHDPESDDEMVSDMVDELARQLQFSPTQPIVIAARERMCMRVTEPIRPVAVPR